MLNSLIESIEKYLMVNYKRWHLLSFVLQNSILESRDVN